MRAVAAVPPHRVLFALALLAPALFLAAVTRARWVEADAARQAHAAVRLTRAREEVAALVRLDRLALDDLRVRLAPTGAPIGRVPPAPAWLSPAALPDLARRRGGIVALFAADAAGTLRPSTPQTAGRPPPETLRDTAFFRALRRGAPLAIGGACPVPTADGLAAEGLAADGLAEPGGFVLALPLVVTAPSPSPRIAGAVFAGVVGACIAPRSLAREWRRRLGPAEGLMLVDGTGRTVLRVPDQAPLAGAGMASAEIARTPLRVILHWAPSAGWRDRSEALAGFALLALGMALALAAAAVASARRQHRTTQALAAAERSARMQRLSAERYRQLYLAAPAAMHALDPSWQILAVSDRWLALLGYRREEVVGRRFEAFLAPPARPAAEQDWTRLLAGDPPAAKRRQLLRRDGTVLEVMVTEQAQRDPDGRLRRAFGLLAEPVGAPVGAPVGTEAGRPDMLTRVAGGIAHDFNNLLMVVMGSLERLVAHADRADTVRRLAGMALAASERGAGLTARLLAAAGRQKLRPELVNPNRLLREAAEAITLAAGPKVEVQFLLSPVLDPARLDPAQFRAALLALVANAREAMPRGGRLSIETANMAGPTPQTGQILVSLSDTGAGMDAMVLARATEPFFTTRPPGKASGLGLSMVQGFVRQSGGSLEIESEPGVGSTVRLLLPRSIDPAAAGMAQGMAQGVGPGSGGDDMVHGRSGGAAPQWPLGTQAKG